jgi:uncharacterized radical SAM superfamily Fe-S cluster-containing enzyme
MFSTYVPFSLTPEDLERIKRCGVHYATPDGRIIPFCTYNTLYRVEVEKKFAMPLLRASDEQKKSLEAIIRNADKLTALKKFYSPQASLNNS